MHKNSFASFFVLFEYENDLPPKSSSVITHPPPSAKRRQGLWMNGTATFLIKIILRVNVNVLIK